MPRNNKVTKRVFAHMVDIYKQKGIGIPRMGYQDFLAVDGELGIAETKELRALKNHYATLAKECDHDIRMLALLEEAISQIRSREALRNGAPELRLSFSRDYIYARYPFFRGGNEINDVRVLVGRTHEWGTNAPELLETGRFRDICVHDLDVRMSEEIERNVERLKRKTVPAT